MYTRVTGPSVLPPIIGWTGAPSKCARHKKQTGMKDNSVVTWFFINHLDERVSYLRPRICFLNNQRDTMSLVLVPGFLRRADVSLERGLSRGRRLGLLGHVARSEIRASWDVPLKTGPRGSRLTSDVTPPNRFSTFPRRDRSSFPPPSEEAPPAPADLKCLHALRSRRILYYCRHTIWSAATCIVLILRRCVSQRAEQSPKDLHYPAVFDRYSCVCTK